jgi:tetratricopeptide (TPR) repeat protein
MKAERRHELQENQLAAWLSGKYVDARPYLTAGVAILAGAALIWVVWNWYSRSTASARDELWNNFYQAASESSANEDTPLREFISEHSKDPVGIAARQRLAFIQMGKGADAQLFSRETSMAAYQEAIDLFDEVRELTDDESLRRFAALQIALCHESRYDLDAAIKEYEAIVTQYKGTAEADRASSRLEDLKNPATKDFYAWHRIVNPAATTPTAPNTVIEPATDLNNLPDSPPADPVPPANPAATNPATTTDPANTDPVTPENPTPPANPTDTPSAGEPPAESPAPAAPQGENPAGESPAGENPAADPPPVTPPPG